MTKNERKDNDILGDFFEAIVTQGFKQDKGQFFTHINIVKFIIHSLSIDDYAISNINSRKSLPYICDPACGSGTFLIEVMKLITNSVKRLKYNKISTSNDVQLFVNYKMPDVKENTWAWDYIYGIEINPDLALATKVNMVLHGDGSGNIFSKDGLLPFNTYNNSFKVSILNQTKRYDNYSYKNELNEQFDFIISNPPFSIKLENDTKKILPNIYQVASIGSSEQLFIERWYQLLKPRGKIGVVLPESVFDTSENISIRQFIFKYFKVKYLVSLPSGKKGAFLPYTPIKTSLLFAEKKTNIEVIQYDNEWRNETNRFNRLKTKILKLINNQNIEEDKDVLKEFLFNVNLNDYKNVSEILNNFKSKINEYLLNSDWWIFSNISKKFDYKILLSFARQLGYHRTKNREFKRENNLFCTDNTGNIIINYESPSTILDFILSGKSHNTPDLFYINFSDISKSLSLRLDHRFHKYSIFEEPIILPNFKKGIIPFRKGVKSIRNGKDIERKFYSLDANGGIIETEYKYLTISNISEEGFDLENIINLFSSKGEELKAKKLFNKNLLITRSGTVGLTKVFYQKDDEVIYIPSGYLIIVNLKENVFLPEFIELYFNSYTMRKYFEIFGTGKTQQNIAQGDILRIPVPNYSIPEQKQILELYSKFYSEKNNQIIEKRKQIDKLNNEIFLFAPSIMMKKIIELEFED